jgi:hypothetical protein
MYFCANLGKHHAARFRGRWEAGGWGSPRTPDFSQGHVDYLPHIMPDGASVRFGRVLKDTNGVRVGGGMYILEARGKNHAHSPRVRAGCTSRPPPN